MSYLKSRARKHDRGSIQLRKELEQLSKKSKNEFNTMEAGSKAEILVREGLSKPTKKGSDKKKDFVENQSPQVSSCPEQRKLEAEEELEQFTRPTETENERQDALPSPSGSAKSFKSGKREVKSKAKGKSDLKTKTRLHEKGVVSIRPDNPELKVVMQGRKVTKNVKDIDSIRSGEELRVHRKPKSPGMVFYYESWLPEDESQYTPAKFAIMGSQIMSMSNPLAPSVQAEARTVRSTSSTSTHGFDENETFVFPWSSEGSASQATWVDDEQRDSPVIIAGKDADQGKVEISTSDKSKGETLDIAMIKEVQAGSEEREAQKTIHNLEIGNHVLDLDQSTTDCKLPDTAKDEPSLRMDIPEFKECSKDQTESQAQPGRPEVGPSIGSVSFEEKMETPRKDFEIKILKNKPEKRQEHKDDLDDSEIDVEKALQDLSLPLEVTASDIVSVSGKKASIVEKSREVSRNKYVNVKPQARDHDDVTFLSTWQEKEVPSSVESGESSNVKIHHFCSQNATVELPPHLTRVSRDLHTVDRHRAVAQRYHTLQETLPRVLPFLEDVLHPCKHVEVEEDTQTVTERDIFERRLSEVAQDILKNVVNQAETFEKLQNTANEMFSGGMDEPLNIQGMKIDLKDDSTRYYWTPAPPKLHLTPAFVRHQIVPAYQGAPVLKDTLGTEHGTIDTMNDDSEDDEVSLDKMDPEDIKARERVLNRNHGSLSNIMDQLSRKPAKSVSAEEQSRPRNIPTPDVNKVTDPEGAPGERFLSVLDIRRQLARIRDSIRMDEVEVLTKESDESELFSNLNVTRRPKSQPDLSNELSLCVSSDYHTSMQELEEQIALVSAIKSEKKDSMELEKPISSKDETSEEKHGSLDHSCSLTTGVSIPQDSSTERKDDAVTETNSIITTTSRGVFSMGRPARKSFRKTHLTHHGMTRKEILLEQERARRKARIQEFLNEPPRMIERSKSLCSLSGDRALKRSPSLPCFMDYDSLNTENMSEADLFYRVQDYYWYKWLDEVYPPSPPPPDILRDMLSSVATSGKPVSQVPPNILDEVDVIKPHIDEASQKLYEDLGEEAEKMTEWIDKTENQETLALYLSRRGAIYRKLGLLKKAWDDLERSIKLEPQLVDSYWHRHLLYLLNEQPKKALEDLAFIIKKNANLVKAYRSRAEIYKELDDSTMAILNYSQAIKLQPDEAEIYYRRAAVFASRGDVILALEDYKVAAELLPSRTDAIFNIGRHYFNQKNWPNALKSFTTMLKQDPLDAKAYLYRGKASAQQGSFDDALKDLSCAIHLAPRNAEAFYQRGCILRKVHPQKALQDLSVSLLLNDSVENVNAFLHRGIIYTNLKRWDEAVCDFESALRLDKGIPSAHVNIGLISITKHQNYARAIKRFSAAVRVDPTYVRGYICRAEAHEKVGNLNESVCDYTKAIHLRPDISDYRMSRGKVLLQQNKLDLASFQIRQAAELSEGLGGSPTQQAVVHAFLKDYDRAVDILTRATRIVPSAPLFILLGKTCMKAKQFEDAIASFKRAIYNLTPWHPRIPMPLSAGSVYFMIGTCYTELDNLASALDAFNNAIKVDPDDAEAYYHRGLTKMKLRHAKSIHDFNRALAIDPKLFQAFLSRAAYYGMKGRFSKGIMNCNEAIKLQPRSVRAYLYRGALKFHISAYKLAVRDLTEAIAIDCTCHLAYFNRAVCYQAMKFYQKALIDYSTVLLTNKEADLEFKVLQNRGLLYLDINDIQNALKDFKEAAKVSPNNPKILHTLGLCYHKLDRLQDAVNSYTEALEMDPFFTEAYIARGNTLMDYGHSAATRLGRYDYLKALHIDPLCLPARVNLGYNLQVENKFQQAWNQFTCALSIDKDCQAALEGRAIVNLQMSNTFGAFVDMNDCLKVSKTAELLTNRGVVQQFMGDTVNAMRDYQAAIQLDPSYSLAYYNAGNLYFRQRQFRQALVYFEKASSWDPRDESAILNAAITKVLLKQFKQALCDFQKAIDLGPYSAHIYFNRGNLYATLGQYEQAENDYTHALHLCPGDALTYKRRADVRGKLSRRDEAIEDYKKAIFIQTSVRVK